MTFSQLTEIAASLPRGTLLLVVGGDGRPEVVEPKLEPQEENPDLRLLQRLKAEGDEPRRLPGWGRELEGTSGLELKRAHEHGALETQVRQQGLGHGAIEATPSAMYRYLALCRAVQEGRGPKPGWWHRVRKSKNARIQP